MPKFESKFDIGQEVLDKSGESIGHVGKVIFMEGATYYMIFRCHSLVGEYEESKLAGSEEDAAEMRVQDARSKLEKEELELQKIKGNKNDSA